MSEIESNSTKLFSRMRYISVIFAGALLMGMLWRIRGEHGWGSLWGLLCVGYTFCMMIFVICRGFSRHTFALLGSAAVSFMFTSPSWGTLTKQITGLYTFTDVPAELCTISPISGIFLMLAMGFGLASLFSFFFGMLFSDKKYKLRHIVIIIVLLFVSRYLSDAFISPFILKAIQPQAENVFSYGLSTIGSELSPFKAHLIHLFDSAWAKDIPGGRNYFASITAISSAVSSLVMALTVRFALHDKVTSKIMLVVCSVFAFSITAADLIFYFGYGGYHMQSVDYTSPFFPNCWALWEYFTGFIAGLLLTAYILKLHKKLDNSTSSSNALEFFEKHPKAEKIYSFVTVILLSFIAVTIRAIILHLDEADAKYTYIALAVAVSIFIAYAILILKNSKKITVYDFCRLSVPLTITVYTFIYMFVASKESMNILYLKTEYASLLVAVSWVLFMIIYILLFIKKDKAQKHIN